MSSHKKIHIIGSVGSGKTTLAKQLSKRYNIPYYELDQVVWMRKPSGDVRRSEDDRLNYLISIVNTNSWIIEGVHNEEWVSTSFNEADIIIFLDPHYHIRSYRIIKRFIKQKLRLEKAHYKPTFQMLWKMFKWNRIFETVGKPNFFRQYKCHDYKIVKIKHSNDIINNQKGQISIF